MQSCCSEEQDSDRGQWGTSAWRRLDYGWWIAGGAVYTSLGDLDGGLGGGPIQWEFSPEARPVYHSKYIGRTPTAFCQKGERNHSETAQALVLNQACTQWRVINPACRVSSESDSPGEGKWPAPAALTILSHPEGWKNPKGHSWRSQSQGPGSVTAETRS